MVALSRVQPICPGCDRAGRLMAVQVESAAVQQIGACDDRVLLLWWRARYELPYKLQVPGGAEAVGCRSPPPPSPSASFLREVPSLTRELLERKEGNTFFPIFLLL